MKEIGWNFRTEISWYKQNAAGKKTAWGSYQSPSNPVIRRIHEFVLVWSKGDWRLRSEEKPDITKSEFEHWTFSTWFVLPETKSPIGHPAPFPEELAKRVIKLFSFPKQTVLDPFSGTGTTSLMACVFNRDYIGIDNSLKYCEYARDRIDRDALQIKEMEALMKEDTSHKSKKKIKEEIIEKTKKEVNDSDLFNGEK